MVDDSIPGKLDALAGRVGAVEDSVILVKKSVSSIETAVQENTELTRDIKDLLTAGKVMTKVIKGAGAIAAAGTAIWAALHLGSSAKG
jgi:hypothetical protein